MLAASLPVVRGGVRRVALLSVHTSPLAQPGTGDGGGLNVYVLEVARRLAARDIAVDVFTRADDPVLPPTVAVHRGLRVHHIEAGPVGPVAKGELPGLMGEFAANLLAHPTAGQHEVVHAHYWLSGWVGSRVAPIWDIPLVQTFHTIGVLKNANLAPGDAAEPALRLSAELHVAQAAERVVGLTCGEARLLHRVFGLSGSRIAVVPAGVDLERFDRPDLSVPEVVRALLPAGEGPLLLFVGRLQPLKGPDVALATLAHVRRSIPDARLLIVGGTSGSGEGRSGPDELAAMAVELGVEDVVRIIPAQSQERLAHLYRAADLLLVPSRTETFGLVALEGQASGTPVIATDVGGLQAVVAGGRLVPGHDPVDHARAAVELLTDPRAYAASVADGLARARATTWDHTVSRLLGVYEAVNASRIASRALAGLERLHEVAS